MVRWECLEGEWKISLDWVAKHEQKNHRSHSGSDCERFAALSLSSRRVSATDVVSKGKGVFFTKQQV